MPAPELSRAEEARSAIASLRSAIATAPAQRADSAQVIDALIKTALILSDAREPIALDLRSALRAETGLSLPMIEWSLLTSLSSMRHAPLAELVSTIPADAARVVIGVVLAGNVFVAAVRGIALPLLAGAHVIAKTASTESAFARAFQAALSQTDPKIGARLAVVQFSREDEAATRALCTGVDVLSVYGSDETVAELTRLCALDTGASVQPTIIAHGHGLSAAYVARSALASVAQAARTAERVALDIAAYDQHGCLSPHFVLVEPGGAVEPAAFAQRLAAEALPALAKLLPPATPTLHEQAEHMQWQATAAVRGELYAQLGHAVSFEPGPLRPSPGGRQISVYACADLDELQQLLGPFAVHLKCIGVAGTKAERSALTERVQVFSSAQVCRSGEMQSPPFDAWADARPPLAGLFRAPER